MIEFAEHRRVKIRKKFSQIFGVKDQKRTWIWSQKKPLIFVSNVKQ